MPKETQNTQDTTVVAQGGGENQTNTEGTPLAETKPFTAEQEQYLGSWLGRIVAKQLDEKVLPEIQNRLANQPTMTQVQSDDVLKTFNEQLQQKIFEGDVLGAIQMANEVQRKSQDILTNQQKTQTTKELINFSDKPFYKEIYSEMKTIAEDVVKQGFPPQAAAEHAYFKAKADYLEGKLRGDSEEMNLNFVEGGRQTPRSTRVAPLPPQFKTAMERDIRDGIVKDEAEYRKSLHPSIRKQFNI